MSLLFPKRGRSVIVRSNDVEVLSAPTAKIKLMVDSNSTGGALSTVRISLEKGAEGAKPHTHHHSAEMFYILDGVVQILSGKDVLNAEPGDLIVVPPHLPHAFSAQRGSIADLLIVITPGVERFDYFRKLTCIARGEEPPESLRDIQDLYDSHFLNSPEWEAARSRR